MEHSTRLTPDSFAPSYRGGAAPLPSLLKERPIRPQHRDRPNWDPAPALARYVKIPQFSTLRVLLRSQLLRQAQHRELTTDERLLLQLTPFLPRLDQATLHQGLRLLMEEDAHAGRPFLAALVGERGGDRPWSGFSRESRRLGGQQRLFLPYGTRYTAWRRAVVQAYRFYRLD